MVAKYKKLCILFHPDKFYHPSSGELFYLLKKWFNIGNSYLINILDQISHFILEVSVEDTLANLLTNLNNAEIENIIKCNCLDMRDAITIFNLLNMEPNKLWVSSKNDKTSNSDINVENFINTTEYQFFMNEENAKYNIDNLFLTEEELIEEIRDRGKYDDNFIFFYWERYKDNENILRVLVELMLNKNEKLKQENEELQTRTARIETLNKDNNK